MFNDGWIHYREGDGLSEPLNIEEETLKIFRELAIPINLVDIPEDEQVLDLAGSDLPRLHEAHLEFMRA